MKTLAAVLLAAALPAAAAQSPAELAAPAREDPALPRVLLIGDSISIGYTPAVRECLKGKANVYRIPANGGPTTRGLDEIEKWLGAGPWHVIHFNWGLHDLKRMDDGSRQVDLPAYETNLRALVSRLKQTGAKLIWASTTPVQPGTVNPVRAPEDVVAYNEVAARIAREAGAGINDLYSFVLPRIGELELPKNVHFTRPGYQALGEVVAQAIGRALK